MRETSTLIYLVNNFESNQNLLLKPEEFTDEEFEEFADVFVMLKKAQFEPGNKTVQWIVDFAKNLK